MGESSVTKLKFLNSDSGDATGYVSVPALLLYGKTEIDRTHAGAATDEVSVPSLFLYKKKTQINRTQILAFIIRYSIFLHFFITIALCRLAKNS